MDEIPDSDSGFSDDDELPSLDAIFKIQPKSSGSVGTVFSKSAKIISSDPLKSDDNREEKWAGFMELIQDAEDDDEVDRVQQATVQAAKKPPSADAEDRREFYDRAVDLVKGGGSDAEDRNSDEDHHWARVKQAMDRQSSTRSAPCYYFFTETTDEEVIRCKCGLAEEEGDMIECDTCKTWQHIKCCYPEDQKEAKRPGFAHWCDDCKPPPQAFLQYAHETFKPARPRHFSLALHTKLATKFSSTGQGVSLPDDLLVWIMRAFPAEKSERIREEYLQILLGSHQQVRDLVNEDQIKCWFLRSGADENAVILKAEGEAARQRNISIERDWIPFQNVLSLLRTCCGSFRTDALVCAVVLLLRASMDGELRGNATVSTAIADTIMALDSAVHDTKREYFCEKVCEHFIPSVDSGALLSRAVEATHHFPSRIATTYTAPETLSPARDLRTRLQLAVFFHSTSPSYHGTARHLVESIISRLEDQAFKARPGVRGDLNFYDLDGYGLALSEIMPYIHLLRSREKDQEKLREIDESINAMRRKVNWICSTVQINGPWDDYDARYEAKTRWTGLDYRISYFFPRKDAGVFGDAREASERRALKSGQEFMAGFMNKKKEVAKIEEEPVSHKGVPWEGQQRVLVLSPKKTMKHSMDPVLSTKKPLRSGAEFLARLQNKRKEAPEPEPEPGLDLNEVMEVDEAKAPELEAEDTMALDEPKNSERQEAAVPKTRARAPKGNEKAPEKSVNLFANWLMGNKRPDGRVDDEDA